MVLTTKSVFNKYLFNKEWPQGQYVWVEIDKLKWDFKFLMKNYE